MFVVIVGLSALNTFLHEQKHNIPSGKEQCYRAVVISEDQNKNRMKLRLSVQSVIINQDTIPLSLYAVHNTYQPDNYLGKTITIKGRLITAKKIYRPNVLIGNIIDKDDYNGFAGRLINSANGYLNKLFQNSFNADYVSIAQGLVLGGSSRLNQELRMVFARAGVLHILAVSGLHIGFLLTFFGVILLLLPIPKNLKFSLIMLALIFYAALTGFRPSVLRASLMAFLFGLSYLLQRRVDPMHIVNMSGLIFLLLDPGMLFDVGAQLSFAAVYGIIYLLPKINNIFLKNIKGRVLKPILWTMVTSFSAQVFVSPFLIYYFNQLPSLAIFSNLLIVPLSGFIIYLLFILIIVSLIFASAVNIISFLTSQLIWLLKKIAELFVSIPFSSISLNVSPIFLMLFFLLFYNKTRKIAIYAICAIAIFFSVSSFMPQTLIKITNNAALIALPDQKKILICNRNVKILPDDFEKSEVNYLIASKKFMEVKKDFIPLPEAFKVKNLKIGDITIQLDKEIVIKWYDNVFYLQDDKDYNIRYYICGRKGIYQFERPLEASVLDDIATDFRIHFGYLKTNL